ncbi:MAG TPA: VOC family protein [Candidatus Saccharimonadales bacterium]|nr:VOC family protein [Candidatus Saccharimonadales bacterium]
MPKITPSLWFDKECEEAVRFYIDTFNAAPHSNKNSKIVSLERYPDDQQIGPIKDMAGRVLTVIFELNGQRFMALDGGPFFKFNESISLYVECKDQAEVDFFWGKLSAVPESEQCGWLKDKYGLSWQIVPKRLGELLSDPNKAKAGRAMQAMLKMKKLDIAALQATFDGGQ